MGSPRRPPTRRRRCGFPRAGDGSRTASFWPNTANLSGGVMARTGLRMMPTSPSPSLKFRTAGFPQYGFKASLSGETCRTRAVRNRKRQLPACPATRGSFVVTLRTPPPSNEDQALSPGRSRASACRCARGITSLPQGSLAPARVLLSRTLIAYSDPIRQSREHAALSRPCRLYAAPSLCGSASATRGTFPTFTAVLSRRAVDHTPVGPRCCPVARAHPGARLPRFVPESPPTRTRLCQQYPAGSTLRRGIVRFMLRPVCLPRPPDWLRPDGVTCAPPGVLRSSVTPAYTRPVAGPRWESG